LRFLARANSRRSTRAVRIDVTQRGLALLAESDPLVVMVEAILDLPRDLRRNLFDRGAAVARRLSSAAR
jgi:hypothetical protein